jgi:predicted HTH domain antitoxin
MDFQISLPKDVWALLGTRDQAVETIKEYTILGLFQEGRISGGKAAELLGLTQSGFGSLLARKGLNYFRLTPEEWTEEARAVKAWSQSLKN